MFKFGRLSKSIRKLRNADIDQSEFGKLVGYSALELPEDCYEYNENACYIADTPETLRRFLNEAMLPLDNYRIDPVKVSDMLKDFGYSGGEYALEPRALERFKNAAEISNIKYSVEPYEDLPSEEPGLFIVNIDVCSRANKQPVDWRKNQSAKEIKDLEAQNILMKLEFNDGTFPREALATAIANRDLVIPHLLRVIEHATQNIEDLKEEETYIAQIYAMYLLAQFREKRAYPLIVDFFSIPGRITLDVTGDVATEALGRILASVSCGDIKLITSLIENRDANEYVRIAGIKGLVTLVACGEIDRKKVMLYFQSLFRKKLEREFSQVWNGLVSSSTDLYPEEVYEDIKQAYDDNLVTPGYIGIDDVETSMQQGKDSVLNKLQHDRFYTLIEDTIYEMESWVCFKQPRSHQVAHQPGQVQVVTKKKKVGRNAPCPCGSGKKYKKCCGR